MEQTIIYDIYIDQTNISGKKTSKIVQIDSTNKVVYSTDIQVFNSPKYVENESKLLIKADQSITSTMKNLNIPNTENSYWNLSANSQINTVELTTKVINDRQINFKLPNSQQIAYIYYNIKSKDDNITELWYSWKGNGTTGNHIIKNGDYQPFIDQLKELTQTCHIVLVIGFQMSIGVNIPNKLHKSLTLIPIYQLFTTLLTYFHPIIKFGVKSYNTNAGIQITNMMSPEIELSNVYFVDSCQIAFEQLTKEQRQQLESSTIHDYYNVYSVQQSDTKLLDANQQIQSFNDEIIHQEWADKFDTLQLLSSRLNMIEMLNVPLNFALFQTVSTCIRTYLFRQFYDQKLLFMYRVSEDTFENIDDDLNGGIFEIMNSDYRFKPIPYVFEGDFFSLYPSIILAFNISPETHVENALVTTETEHLYYKKQVNYKSGQLSSERDSFKCVYFIKETVQPGIFPILVEKLLKKRKEVPKTSTQYKTLKVILATIYGVIGMKYFPLYNISCQKVICSLGRQACDVAMKTLQDSPILGQQCILARYTDSCQFRLNVEGKKPFSCIEKLREAWPGIQKKIQDLMQSPLFIFQLEDNMSIVKMYLAQINSSIAIQVKTPTTKEETKGLTISQIDPKKLHSKAKDYRFSLSFKGMIHWDKYSLLVKQLINYTLIKILLDAATDDSNPKDFSIIKHVQTNIDIGSQVVQACIAYIRGQTDILDIKIGAMHEKTKLPSSKGIQQTNDLLKDRMKCLLTLSTICKFSDRENTSKYLQQTYNIQNSCYIVPFLDKEGFGSKLVSMSYIPFQYINNENFKQIDFSRLKYMLELIFILFDNQHQMTQDSQYASSYLIKTEEIDPEKCQVRIEEWCKYNSSGSKSIGKVNRTFQIMPLIDLEIFVQQNQSKSIHEILSNPINKLHFDIERMFTNAEFDTVTEQVEALMTKMTTHEHANKDQSTKVITDNLDLHISTQLRGIVHQVFGFPTDFNNRIIISIAKAHKATQTGFKYSIHCVVNVACTKQINYFTARILDKLLQVQLGVSIVDCGIYNPNSTLRLPGSIKIDKVNGPEQRIFTYGKTSCFNDFIISDIYSKKCVITFKNDIIFDVRPPITINRLSSIVSVELTQKTLQTLKDLTGKQQWTIDTNQKNKGILRFNCGTAYKCPVCTQKHTSDGIFGIPAFNVLHNNYLSNKCTICPETHTSDQILNMTAEHVVYMNCFSNKLRQANVHKPIPVIIHVQDEIIPIRNSDVLKEDTVSVESLQAVQSKKQKQFEAFTRRIESIEQDSYKGIPLSIQDNQYVKYDLTHPTTYIISGMGSGKSAKLSELLPNYKTIVCLSFRITFTVEFSKKYNLVSYQDIEGGIYLNKTPKVIIQVDSLFRFQNREMPDLVIIDEIESILEKIESSGQQWSNIYNFIQLIRDAKTLVIMDGLMEPRTIQYINLIRNTDNVKVVYNQRLPRTDYKLKLYQFHSSQFQYVIDKFIKYLKQGKRIYGMITQKKLGNHISEKIIELTGKTCIFYNGDNLKYDDNMVSHKVQKENHFQDVDANWINYDVVLHSSTVTAGVSFNIKDYFDVQINVLSNNTCSAVSFMQGCHRVRHLKDQKILSFIEPVNQQGEHCPLDQTLNQYDFHATNFNPNITTDIQRQVQSWLLIRKIMSTDCIIDLVIKYAKSMGYQIKASRIPETFKGSKLSIDKLKAEKIASIVLPKTMDLIRELEPSQQQHAMLKVELMFLYQIHDDINAVPTSGISALISDQHLQKIRIKQIAISSALNDSEEDRQYWKHDHDWLIQTKYKASNQLDIDHMAESILKAKALLIYVRENNLSATEFIKYCGDAKFDMNVLNIIKSLQFSVRSPKGTKFDDRTKYIIGFMKVLCYKFTMVNEIVTFTRTNIFQGYTLTKPIEEVSNSDDSY